MIVSELRHKFPLKALLKLSGLARSTYYYYLKQQGTDKYCVVKQKIEKIFTENKQRYGYRRILLVLRRQGIKLNHKTVHKLMRSMGLHGKRRKSKYKSYKGEVGKIAANILSRDFVANKPFEKLATDVTEFAVCDDKVYLSPVLDLHNNEVISYSISLSPNFEQIQKMLKGLFDKLPQDARPILHFDRTDRLPSGIFKRKQLHQLFPPPLRDHAEQLAENTRMKRAALRYGEPLFLCKRKKPAALLWTPKVGQ